jgi:hypothetical protein
MAAYKKLSDSWRTENAPKTLAALATLAGGQGPISKPDAPKAEFGKSDSGSAKAAKVAKVGASGAVCAVCGAPDDLWQFGGTLTHQECARFLPRLDRAEPSLAYREIYAGPDGGHTVTIIELPQARRYRKTFVTLQLRPPALVPLMRWRQCVEDGKRFLAKWGAQAERLGWTSADLFGLHRPSAAPHPSYDRLSRYDCTGLVWQLRGRSVTMLTESAATFGTATGGLLFRKHDRPALGPVGDSLEDFK